MRACSGWPRSATRSRSNYTSFRFSERLQDNGILPSMGSVGDSYDNALMENFWSTLKIELVYRTSWRTRDEAENAIFAYIDGWYNTRRIQRELGYLSPNEYEAAWHSRQTEPAEPPIATLHQPGAGNHRSIKAGEFTSETIHGGCSPPPHVQTVTSGVACLTCREHAHREHLRLPDEVERLSRMPGTNLDREQTVRAADNHRAIVRRFAGRPGDTGAK
nr:IS3 family transposase [Micromonospora sp. KC721]